MKKRFFLLASASLLSLASCGGSAPEKSKELSLSFLTDNPTTLTVGQVTKIGVDFQNGGGQSLIYAIDDPLIGSVDQQGNVTPLRSGILSLTVTPSEDEEKAIQTYLEVKYPTGISVEFSRKTTTLAVGSTYAFQARVTGDNSNQGVGYQVNNHALASITQEGELTILSKGVDEKVTVTAYSLANPDATADVVVSITGDQPTEGIETVHGYSLIFKDDFSDGRLSDANWTYMTGDGSAYDVVSGWGNEEQEFYRKENVKVVDGKMIITAKKADALKNKGMPYTSGRIRSKNKVSYKYGRIEARIACPFGSGIWPAFWMLPESEGTSAYGGWPNSGEIDIMEAKGRIKYSTDGTIHFADSTGAHTYRFGTYVMPEGQDISQFHDYAVEWDEGEMRWYVDGNLYHKCNAETKPWSVKTGTGEFPAPFDKKFHLLFNMAVGGNYDGYRMPSEDETPAQLKVEYVKWYQ